MDAPRSNTESQLDYTTLGGAKARHDWLTEIELTIRVREELIKAQNLPRLWLRCVTQGRQGGNAARHDIEIGNPPNPPIEVLYLWAQRTASPYKPFNDDLHWLLGGQPRHVVAFFPTMRPGYAINNHPQQYDLGNAHLKSSQTEYILSRCLQIGNVSTDGHALCDGVFQSVPKPVAGNERKWSLVQSVAQRLRHTLRVRNVGVERSLVDSPADNLWAIVWSNT